MTSGGQCVMTSGVELMLLWSAGNWVIVTVEVSFLGHLQMVKHAFKHRNFEVHGEYK